MFALGASLFISNLAYAGNPFISSATAISSTTSASLTSSIDPNGDATTAWFEYSTSNSFATFKETNHVFLGNASSTSNLIQNLNQSIGDLTPKTIYYFRAVADNGKTLVKDITRSFTTTIQPNETLTNNQETAISAKLNGTFINNNKTPSKAYFEYGITQSLGTKTASKDIETTSPINFFETVNGLLPNTTYYFRAVVINQGLAYIGNTFSFKTPNTGSINTSNEVNSVVDNNSTGLEANAIFGINFLPDTLLGWLSIIFVVLGILLLGRNLYSDYSAKDNKKTDNEHDDYFENLNQDDPFIDDHSEEAEKVKIHH